MNHCCINQLKSGYTSCFEEIYFKYNKKLYNYFFKRIGVDVICEDLVQDTFIRLWTYRTSLDETLSIDIQLFRIAKTSLINVVKKRAQLMEVSVANHELPDRMEDNSSMNIINGKKEQLQHLIKILPASRKKIIELRMEGFSNKEIACMLNISIKTVENSLNTAYQELRQISSVSAFLLIILLH